MRAARNTCQYIIMLSFLMFGSAYANQIDQSQQSYITTADLARDGTSGQTFTAGLTCDLLGIRLVVEGSKWSGDYPYGSDFTVNLRPVINGTPSDNILTSGTLSKDDIELNTPQWLEILFDTPYQQTQGELLAFTILELSGGGGNGWNQYGMEFANPYLPGQQFYGFEQGEPLTNGGIDMAFETIVTPEPATILLLAFGITLLRKKQ